MLLAGSMRLGHGGVRVIVADESARCLRRATPSPASWEGVGTPHPLEEKLDQINYAASMRQNNAQPWKMMLSKNSDVGKCSQENVNRKIIPGTQ